MGFVDDTLIFEFLKTQQFITPELVKHFLAEGDRAIGGENLGFAEFSCMLCYS